MDGNARPDEVRLGNGSGLHHQGSHFLSTDNIIRLFLFIIFYPLLEEILFLCLSLTNPVSVEFFASLPGTILLRDQNRKGVYEWPHPSFSNKPAASVSVKVPLCGIVG